MNFYPNIKLKKIRSAAIITFLLLALLVNSQISFAQQNHSPKNEFQCNAAVLNSESQVVVGQDGKEEFFLYEIQIKNRDGDKYSRISIPFTKTSKVYDITAYLYDKNGKEIRKLKKSEITECSNYSDESFFTDEKLKQFTMQHNDYPYTLKYTYTQKAEHFPYICFWSPILNRDIPTYHSKLTVTVPNHFKIRYKTKGNFISSTDSNSTTTTYTWTSFYLSQIHRESFSPPFNNLATWVKIFPESFYYEDEGSYRSWIEFGNWNQRLLSGLSDLPESEISHLKEKVEGIADDKEKIRALYHYLQDATRYINVSIGTGGLKPYPASYVASNKYGDCKALANYFKVCLSHFGIKAYYSLINAGDAIPLLDENFPSLQFNHVILFIPINNDTLWVDCTSSNAFGYVGTFIQNRESLVTEIDKSRLLKVPALSPDAVLELRNIKARITGTDIVNLEVKCLYKGDKYELLASIDNNLPESKKKEYITENFIEFNNVLEDYEISQVHRDSAQIELKYNALGEKIKNYGSELLLSVNKLSIPITELPSSRTLPVQINYPIYKIDSLEYSIPECYSIKAVPENLEIKNQFGMYHIEFKVRNNQVFVIKSFLLQPGYYEITTYKDLFSFLSRIRMNEKNNHIILIEK